MFVWRLIVVAALAAIAGCTHVQLARNTVTQANSHTDIHYRQVLNNLAAFECNPNVLPHFSVIGTGGTQVTDIANSNLGLAWDARSFIGSTLGFGGEREMEDGWTLAPVVNPDKLRAIRCAYQLTTRGETTDQAGYALLKRFLTPDYMAMIEPGWYRAGCKQDVPKHACYIAHCGDRYVWVTADGLEGLSRMTLVVLNIATLDANALAERAYPPPNKNGEQPDIKLLPAPQEVYEGTPLPRENYYNPLQSQIQMSGSR